MRGMAIGASCLAFGMVSFAGTAQAWWDFAKWGMTEQQVVAASKGRAQPCTQSDQGPCSRLMDPITKATVAVPRLSIPSIAIAGESASVSFFFDDTQKLSRTFVNFQGTHYRRVVDLLNGTYGAPVEQRPGTFATTTWRDAAKGTLIKATDILGNVRVTYEPIKSGL